jgi:hypothetical protein
MSVRSTRVNVTDGATPLNAAGTDYYRGCSPFDPKQRIGSRVCRKIKCHNSKRLPARPWRSDPGRSGDL